MPIIKISMNNLTWPLLRQTSGNSGKWENVTFIVNQNIKECDAWVVIDDLLYHKEQVFCPSKQTLFVNLEPPSQRSYPDKFLAQFASITTCGGHKFNHSNVQETFPLIPWYIGINLKSPHRADKKNPYRFDYDAFKNMPPPQKGKKISVICSDKTFTSGHRKRYEFVQRLQAYFGDRLDVFGSGQHFITDKWDALADYEYHILIENSRFPHYWTEKLADTFLAWTYPIYYGCPNVFDYFDKNSLSIIDIDYPEEAIRTIENILKENTWNQKLNFIAHARHKIIDDYNIFPMIIKLLSIDKNAEKQLVKMQSTAQINGRIRTSLQKIRARLQFGLGITKIFPCLRKI